MDFRIPSHLLIIECELPGWSLVLKALPESDSEVVLRQVKGIS